MIDEVMVHSVLAELRALRAVAEAARVVRALWERGWGVDGHALGGPYPGYRSVEGGALVDALDALDKEE